MAVPMGRTGARHRSGGFQGRCSRGCRRLGEPVGRWRCLNLSPAKHTLPEIPFFQRFSLVLLTGESRLPGPGAALSLCRWAGAGQAKAGEAGRRCHSHHSHRALAPVVPSLPPEDVVFLGLHNNGRRAAPGPSAAATGTDPPLRSQPPRPPVKRETLKKQKRGCN